ncbi:MAG: DUF4118 domain-containing protein [Sulfurovaceae bacterium]|nr:DUF4118 domain-containing protein [Sulfurovaceae bacterium]
MFLQRAKFFQSLALTAFITIIALIFFDKINLINTAMLFMIPILFSALYNKSIEVFFISIIAVLFFNFLFIPPRFNLGVHDPNYIISFLIMIATGQMVSSLAKKATISKEHQMSQKIQDALLESLSHELRTPLAVIKGCSSILSEQRLILDDNERKNIIDTIDENTEDMEKHIGNLINSAKLKNGILQLKKELCDIEEIIGSALLKTEKEQVAFLKILDDIPLIYANAIFIEQAVINLLDNAFKYGYNVLLEVKEEPNGISVEVSNRGDVLSQSEISQATNAFTRLSNSNSKRGLGLGLHVVKLIAQIHNGALMLSSKNDRFYAKLFLPKRNE